MQPSRIFETVLYAEDLTAAEAPLQLSEEVFRVYCASLDEAFVTAAILLRRARLEKRVERSEA